MKRWVAVVVGLGVLGCGGLIGGHSEFAMATAQMLAEENDGVECRLTSTGGGTTSLLDFEYTFGDPVVRLYPDEMKPMKNIFGKVIGERKYMMVVPVTVTNTLPKKRAHDRTPKFHRTDGEIYNTVTEIPEWVAEAIGKPNLNGDNKAYAPNESRDTFLMLSVDSPEAAIGSVVRMWFTEKRPDPNNPRRTYHATQDQICIEVASVTEVDPLTKP